MDPIEASKVTKCQVYVTDSEDEDEEEEEVYENPQPWYNFV